MAMGVCTFRRPALARTLESLAAQTLPLDVDGCIIVADNDETPSARPLVDQARVSLGMPLHYVHAPQRNISIARNAVLDRAREIGADVLAMIDDDETADPGWAQALLGALGATRTDVVLGRVIGVYGPDTPDWMRAARLHDVGPVIQPDGRILTGSSANAILRLDSAHLAGRRFDLAFGQTGGEDDVFFHGMVRDGGTIGYAPDAIVREAVPRERERLGNLMRRYFRAGQTYGFITKSARPPGRAVQFAKAAAKAGVLAASALLVAFWPARRTRALMRASLHAGVCWHLVGGGTVQVYKS
jgi:succinoglycan biosynthesis protein ExoM